MAEVEQMLSALCIAGQFNLQTLPISRKESLQPINNKGDSCTRIMENVALLQENM